MKRYLKRFYEALYLITVCFLGGVSIIASVAVVLLAAGFTISLFINGFILYGFLALLLFIVLVAALIAAIAD